METHMNRFRVRLPKPGISGMSRGSKVSRRRTACDRCRRLKKECSRTLPNCSACAKARLVCSLRHAVTDEAGVINQSKPAERCDLGARLAWMEELISQGNLLPHGTTLDQITTGTDLSEILNKTSPPVSAPADQLVGDEACVVDALDEDETRETEREGHQDDAASATSSTSADPNQIVDQNVDMGQGYGFLATASELQQEAQAHHHDPDSDASHSTPLQATGDCLQRHSPNSRHRTARTYVDAYFRDINRTYPFVDREKVLSTLNAMGDMVMPPAPDDDVNVVVLYLVMAIGCTTLQRTEAQRGGPCFVVDYKELMFRCMMRESIDSIQVLLLLAICSLFDPWCIPTASIVDLLARQAVRLRLTRRHTADRSGRLLSAEAERNHRLFWSIYALDRTIAVSTGTPVALDSTNMDVPLPCITVDEFASPSRLESTHTLQVARHIIQLRILEDKVLHEVHLRDRKSTARLTRDDRRSIIADLRTAIENWYSNGCLLQSVENDNDSIHIHIRISWLASRYYNLLLLLHYPSHFNPPSMPFLSQSELVSLAQKHIQAVSIRFHQRQLPLNHLTLCRLFPVCMIFMRASLELGSHEPILARDEISTCADILESFPEKWTLARRAAAVVRQLLSPLASAADENAPSNLRGCTRGIFGSGASRSDALSDSVGREEPKLHLVGIPAL
ncbi:Fungal-trans domain-containing protein [Fusarium sp. LHS14.1]|nr:Fungal-trans domain-containing protein [Fusarium sp. LHS14.1]